MFAVKLAIAVVYDIIDALNIIPGVGDVIEGMVEGGLGYLLTQNPKATIIAAFDGILPPPFDFFPTTTAVVIADEVGWLD